MLSDSESDGEATHQLTINEHYAKAFEYRKEREELEKLKLKYGSDFEEDDEEDSETDSESAESEDEDGEELTPAVDAAILRTLARIKRKDPEIYDAEKGVFEEEQKKLSSAKTFARAPKDKPSKPVTMRQVVLESELNHATSRSPSPEPLPHVEEQRALRDETIAVFHQAANDGDDDDDGFLIPREKTKDEAEKEEEEYRAFLEREVGGDLKDLVTIDSDTALWKHEDGEGAGVESKKKKKKKKDSKEKTEKKATSKDEADHEFLMNYILNRGWIDRASQHIPTYGEITGPKSKSKGKGKEKQEAPAGDSDADSGGDGAASGSEVDEEEFEEIVDRFESSYNFRFEEPDAAVIKGFPRVLPETVRREDTTRKDARARKKQRKEEEMQKKREEVKRLKALKMKELRAKLDMIGKEGGKSFENDPALQELDLDAEWDPAAHDQQMAGLYGDDDDMDYNDKPDWEDDIDIGDIPISDDDAVGTSKKTKKKKKKKGKEPAEDEGVDMDAMDAEVERIQDDEEWDGTEEMRKRKLDEYMDEIYGLDFNDMVGGMTTRFNYTAVQPQHFALTPAEILMATDAELNEYMGIKKYAPYKNNKQLGWDSQRPERLMELKGKLADRLGTNVGGRTANAAPERPAKKRMGKKERMKLKAEAGEGGEEDDETIEKSKGPSEVPKDPTPVEEKKRKRSSSDKEDNGDVQEQEQVSSKKKRRRHKKKDADA